MSSLIKEQEFIVQVAQPAPETNTPVKMEVGIENASISSLNMTNRSIIWLMWS